MNNNYKKYIIFLFIYVLISSILIFLAISKNIEKENEKKILFEIDKYKYNMDFLDGSYYLSNKNTSLSWYEDKFLEKLFKINTYYNKNIDNLNDLFELLWTFYEKEWYFVKDLNNLEYLIVKTYKEIKEKEYMNNYDKIINIYINEESFKKFFKKN